MKKLIYLAVCLCASYVGCAQDHDLKAEINQSAFNKIVNSIKIPTTLFVHDDPFRTESTDVDDFRLQDTVITKTFSLQRSSQFFVESVRTNPGARTTSADDVFSAALAEEWLNLKAEIRQILDQDSALRAGRVSGFSRIETDDVSIEELKKIHRASVEEAIQIFRTKEAAAFGVKAHLAYLRVDLTKRPSLKVESPDFDINNIRVTPTARGELWVKVPTFKCCRTVFGICVCIKVTWKWKRIASLTISPDIGADATISFSESNLKVYARGKFRKLFLDYNILREFNLAPLANRYMDNKPFEVYDASAFMASLPYINTNMRIEKISIPKMSSGVRIEIAIKQ